MIDFDAMVLGPAQLAFGRPVTILPLASQPGVASFPAGGDFRRPHTEVQLADGEFTTVSPTLGIRASEYPILPAIDDKIVIGAETFLVVDVRPDGEGDVKLVLRKVSG
ncbi:hypothetical protein K32_24040 [Kaistia sp. 32K]|uniref:head-tail joining protein n=1 Tax=Kaistia sp. 32K TaxID=2795690 RepID=UPI001914DE8E|nr:hypothetical protein [Kaistia sp. 32K]BCP53787.1 hypothetical protein K32_24040 [Kaistia sp. 32K]